MTCDQRYICNEMSGVCVKGNYQQCIYYIKPLQPETALVDAEISQLEMDIAMAQVPKVRQLKRAFSH